MTNVNRRITIKTYLITVVRHDLDGEIEKFEVFGYSPKSVIDHYYRFVGDYETCEIISVRRV